MKNIKKFLSASVALAALLLISGNISGMKKPVNQDINSKIRILNLAVDNLDRKIIVLESVITDNKLISRQELESMYIGMGVVSGKDIEEIVAESK